MVAADSRRLPQDFGFTLGSGDLFDRLLERAQAVWFGAANRARLGVLLPESARGEIGNREFFAMALHVRAIPYGMIYADMGDDPGVLDESRYNAFKQICVGAGQALEHLST